jgi:hypothetical protein
MCFLPPRGLLYVELSILNHKEKGKKFEKSIRQTKQSITKSIEENDKDATILLSMGKSYSQYERERLGLYCIFGFFLHFFQKGIFVKTVIGVFTMVFLWFDFTI